MNDEFTPPADVAAELPARTPAERRDDLAAGLAALDAEDPAIAPATDAAAVAAVAESWRPIAEDLDPRDELRRLVAADREALLAGEVDTAGRVGRWVALSRSWFELLVDEHGTPAAAAAEMAANVRPVALRDAYRIRFAALVADRAAH